MNTWSDFVRALGQNESGKIVTDLCRKVGELPDVSETPDNYNDPEGKTRFYKFTKSGIEIGFRSEKLNHIHFFVQPHEGYLVYTGDVLGRIAQAWHVQDVIAELGSPSKEAPGRVDVLIGYVQQWLKYEFKTYALRMEFSEGGRLWKATLISS
ncbi:hypothetical protein [Pseudomonas corrugata]|uniref:hypothetical protein n=1 Tax=Pseudomonas corrugata TaxID=47879 RepID=UPI0009BE4CFB|nr:hypothetical protein [Pseudomonas corrugata]MDU9026233.1 hypothetical protein [Pseudomonas corrugata]UZE07006.1 hypothetical protein LOY65_03490 [Pseudomonas corrugata]